MGERKHAVVVGALGVIEMTAPTRAGYVDRGLRRLAISGKERHYFALHAVLDVKHSETWNREILRSLVQRIVLTPEEGELKIELIGDLAGILTIAVKAGTPSGAVERNNSKSQTQKSRPVRAAVLSNLASQVEMVAGAGFEPTTFRL